MDTEKTVNGAGESSPAPDGSAADLVETFNLVRDLRNAVAAAMGILASYGHTDEFLYEAHRAGVADGIGVRSADWLKQHAPPNATGERPEAQRAEGSRSNDGLCGADLEE